MAGPTITVGPDGSHSHAGRAYEDFDSVDGQQRLTAVVFLLDAIRRELATLPNLLPLAIGTAEAYLHVSSAAGEPLDRLRLNADTDGYWRDSVLADASVPAQPVNASQERLVGAKRHFAAYLERQRAVLGPDYGTWLQGLRTKVTSNLVFVLYEVSTSAEVGVIFEVMNDRGKPLTELEKAKNYLLYLSNKLDLPSHGLTEFVNAAWAEILSRLMRAGLSDPRYADQLLRAHWLTVYDYDRR